MASPHHEDDAQEWHVVHITDFIPGTFHPGRLHTLRLVLSQPSGLWKKSTLQSVECFEEIHLSSGPGVGVGAGAGSKSSSSNHDGERGVSFPSARILAGDAAAESPFVPSSTYNVASAESGSYRVPSLVVASLQNRTNELKGMIGRLRDCKRSKLGNPGSTLDFGAGAATLVKIKNSED